MLKHPKDWCTSFPEHWVGKDISECCKQHDNDCNTASFFKCLYKKVGLHSLYISAGGMLGCLFKYFKL